MNIETRVVKKDNKLIVRNSIFLTIRMVYVLLIGIYISRVLLQELGILDYGIYNVVCGFVSMFAFLNTSMNNGIQRFYNYELGRNGIEGAKEVYNCTLITQIVIAVIVVVLTESIGLWYINNKLVIPIERFDAAIYIFHFSIGSLLIVIMQIPYSAAIMAHEKMDYYAVCSVVDITLKLLIVLILPYYGYDYLKLYSTLIFCVSALVFFMYYVYAKLNFNELNGSFSLNRKLFGSMVKFTSWNLFGSFSNVIKEQGINLLLNVFFGPVVNAARGLAYQVSGGVQSFIVNITTAARPQLTQSYAIGEYNRTIRIMNSMSKMSYMSLFVFTLPVILEVDYVLEIWLGGIFPLHTNDFIVLILLYTLINVFNPPVSFVVHATGNMKKYQIISGFTGLLLLPVSYFILYKGACPEYVFILNIIFMIVIQIISLFILKTIINFSITKYVKEVIVPLTLFTIFVAIVPCLVYAILDQGFIRLVIVCITSVVFTAIWGYIIVLNHIEKNIICEYCRKIRNKLSL